MPLAPPVSTTRQPAPDWATLVAISALAYLLAVGLHEHLGHAAACVVLGSRPLEVGAFYVDCDYSSLSDARIRLVALAGPVVSLVVGVGGFLVLRRLPRNASPLSYFVWLLGTIGLMSATGYLLFSGISGIGDFGTGRDGVLYHAAPEWFWRIVLTIAGVAGYVLTIFVALRAIDPRIAGAGDTRVGYASRLALTSYLTGAVVFVAIGLLNPHGLIIVLISAAASSLGATSGLLWMMQLLDRKRETPGPGLIFQRNWRWIALGGLAALVYAIVLGPTLRP